MISYFARIVRIKIITIVEIGISSFLVLTEGFNLESILVFKVFIKLISISSFIP